MPAKISPSLKTTILSGIISACIILMLSACSNVPKRWDPQAYSVKKGDTLYSIAWRYEKDFRHIALWNDIHPPYAIFPGQRLIMQPVNQDGTVLVQERAQVLIDTSSQQLVVVTDGETDVVARPEPTKVKRTHVLVENNDTHYSIARSEGFTHHQVARWNHLKAPYLLKPGQKLRLSPSINAMGQTAQQNTQVIVQPLVSAENTTTAQTTVQSTDNNTLPTRVDKWHWPVKGRVTTTYKSNDTSRKGIGISGKPGQSINAAAGGTVVYSGNGLINYGNLIIIKHSHSFLSAYAHNKLLLVKEGDFVKPRQAIARIGQNEAGKSQLHFEIRRNGKPVNPLNYLPKT